MASVFTTLAPVGSLSTGENATVRVEIVSRDGGAPFVGVCAFFGKYPSRGGLGQLSAENATALAGMIAKGAEMLKSVPAAPVVASPATQPAVQGGASCVAPSAPAKRKQGRPLGSKNKAKKAA